MKKTAAFILAILSVIILVSCTKVEKFKDDAGNVIKKYTTTKKEISKKKRR